ncbi:hypothetical protein MRS60_32095 [Burkholderia pyrrocinia]|uniref:hypothetical protein n=1 Tax=Burkholderia pyrrocinia TaxID=60550 RepID=UPI001FB4872A|nr:hypothetical protein [Burkholderia pyrrocinia]UOB60600.1 hypothetical protein MRS60_32095 [Burkholderia pyrrocinia]
MPSPIAARRHAKPYIANVPGKLNMRIETDPQPRCRYLECRAAESVTDPFDGEHAERAAGAPRHRRRGAHAGRIGSAKPARRISAS